MMQKWYGDKVNRAVFKEANKRLARAAIFIVRYCRRKLSKAGFGKPGAAGDFPHKQTGWLRQAIEYELQPQNLAAFWGTNVPYGKWLELGTRKMSPHPWMSRTNAETQRTVNRLLGGKL